MSRRTRTSAPDAIAGDRSLVLALLLAALTIAGAFALLPSTEEKAAALVVEGRRAEALSLLASTQSERGLTSHEHLLLADLYAEAGEPAQAAALLNQLASEPAYAASVLPRLLSIYATGRDYSLEADAARRLYEISPTQEVYARLRILYRLLGDWRNEMSFLDLAIGAGHASDADVIRRERLGSVGNDTLAAAVLWRAPLRPIAPGNPS